MAPGLGKDIRHLLPGYEPSLSKCLSSSEWCGGEGGGGDLWVVDNKVANHLQDNINDINFDVTGRSMDMKSKNMRLL